MNSGERKNRFKMRFAGRLTGLILSVLSLLLVFGCLTAFAAAGDTVMSGQNGSVSWKLIDNGDETYTMDIAGSGSIPDSFMSNTGNSVLGDTLGDKLNQITDVKIGKGITGIGARAFYSNYNNFNGIKNVI